MSLTADVLKAGGGASLWYYLKINGLPYYFCSVIKPDDDKYGFGSWNFDSYEAIPGMEVGDAKLTQSIPDIIGGIASAERVSVTLTDVEKYTLTGSYRLLDRLFSPGVTVASGIAYELASDIPATAGAGFAIKLRSGTVTPATGSYSIGGETLTLGSFGAPVDDISTGTITTRNNYPCAYYQPTGLVFPPTPSHRIVRNEGNIAAGGRNILVTPFEQPFSMIGRHAALYVAHMEPNGWPCTEIEPMLRLVGKIRSVDMTDAGQYRLEIESVVGDLANAKVASGLGIARIKDDQIVLPLTTRPGTLKQTWREINIQYMLADGKGHKDYRAAANTFDVAGNVFTLDQVLTAINKALIHAIAAQQYTPPSVSLTTVDGEQRVMFSVHLFEWAYSSVRISPQQAGLMNALGFEFTSYGDFWEFERTTPEGQHQGIARYELIASRPAPSIFIPARTYNSEDVTFNVVGMDGSTSQYFFTDQANGQSGEAYAQFDDGTVVEVNGTGTNANGATLTIGRRYSFQETPTGANGVGLAVEHAPPYYYSPRGASAPSIKQVVLAGSATEEVDAGLFIARLLASYDSSAPADNINYYGEGIGLSWNQIIDHESFASLGSLATPYRRLALIDSSTTFKDIILPILKEHSAAIVWDVDMGRLSVRPLRIPSAASASLVPLSESNRTKPDDRTRWRIDPSNIRTSWTLKWGWDIQQKKFLGAAITIVDNAVLSTGIIEKSEEIEDKTLVVGPDLDALEFLNTIVFARSPIYRSAWIKCARTMNNAGMTLSPGTYHKVIDNTIPNPFTGKRGITSTDAVYALLTSVSADLTTGLCDVEFVITNDGESSLYRPWAPSGLVDYTAPGHGYNTGTGVLTMTKLYSSHATYKDGWDFKVGDPIVLMSWDNNVASMTYFASGLISAIAVDGSTVTIPSGFAAVPDGVELLLLLNDHVTQNVDRKANIAWQGSGYRPGVIQSDATARNNRWG